MTSWNSTSGPPDAATVAANAVASIHTMANSASTAASAAQTAANSASSAASAAQSTANSANTTANNASSTASSANSLATTVQSDFNASQSAFSTMLSSWQTTINTGGQTWQTMWNSLESAWSTYVQANSAIQANEWATLTQLIQGIFGVDPSTGFIPSSSINGWTQQFDDFANAVQGDPANAGSWAWLGQIMNGLGVTANNAHDMAVSNTNTLGIRNNKPLIYGLDDTTESNIPFNGISGGHFLPVTGSYIVFVRCQHTDIKNTIAFIAYSAGSTGPPTHFYVDLYTVNLAAQTMTLVVSSADLSAQLGTAAAWHFTSANATPVNPGDVLAIGFRVVQASGNSGTVNVYGAVSNTPSHPTAQLPNLTAFYSAGVSSSVPFSALNFSDFSAAQGQVPYVGLEVSNPPPPSYPPKSYTIQSYGTHTIASYLQAGDFVDLVGIGGGGGGQGETGSTQGRGGIGASWNARTLTVGTDIAAGGTITISPGVGGTGGQYFQDGEGGGATTFSWNNAAGTAQTLTCAGGDGGGLAHGNENALTYGLAPSPLTYTYQGETYRGGSTQINGAVGNYPGGGGSGGYAFQYGWAGGNGEAWIVERQA